MVTTVTDNSPQSINTSLFAMDGEIQKVKKIAESFDEKLSGIDIETGVLSVNGKQGVVELDASDVDALPSSTVIPTTTSELENTSGFITINDVGASFVPITRKVNNKALNSDITLTASDVGALPNTTVIPTKTSQLTNDNGFITSSGSITGNAATATKAGTADKVKNALTVNGKTYDGSSAVNAGVQTVENGGTGATDAESGFNTLADGVRTSHTPVDNETMLFRSTSWYKTTCLDFWNYIKDKISSVLGLTKDNYGGNAATATKAGTATNATTAENAKTAATATRVEDGYNVVQYKSISFNGFKMHDTQEKALYVEGRGDSALGDSGGIAITNDGVTAFGAGDTDGVFRVINEDNVSAGSVFKVMKDGQVYTTNVIHGSIDGSATKAGNADRATGIAYTGEDVNCISAKQFSMSFNNSESSWASYIICNHGDGKTYYHQMLRFSFFEDKIQLQRRVDGYLQGWKTIAIIDNSNTWGGKQTFSAGIRIPVGQPNTVEDGDIWIS